MRAAAALLLVLLAGCARERPEARINRVFDEAVGAVQAGDAAGAAERLSPRFTGPEGMDRASARAYLAAILFREKVGVTVVGRRVEVRGAEAVQTVDLILTGRTGTGLLPQESSRRTLTLLWELRDGTWRIRELQTD